MADINKAALGSRVLEHLCVVAAGQTPATADATLVAEEVDATYARLRKFGYAPFPTSAIPDWAQQQLCDIVAYKVCPKYGVTGQRLIELAQRAKEAEFDLNRQTSGSKHKRRTSPEWF